MLEIANKVVVITGGSAGIGEAIGKAFVDEGAYCVLLSRDAGRAEAARTRIGKTDRTMALACDVRNREEMDRVISLTRHHFKRIDVWVNNAGHGVSDAVATMDMPAFRGMFETNFFGTVEAMQAVLPLMREQGSGTVINISSVAGHLPVPYLAGYSATKFAMNAMGKAANVEMAGTGVNVLTVCPGYVSTNFGANVVKGRDSANYVKTVKPKTQQGITAERVARAVLGGYRNQKREVIVPWTMHPVVKIYQLFPSVVEKFMVKMARKPQ
jgi:short-subunit dehydrogenase